MSESWEMFAWAMVIVVSLIIPISREFREIQRKLAGISSTLDRLEDKIDGHDRSSYRG
jgi:uncharacterized protein YoxC